MSLPFHSSYPVSSLTVVFHYVSILITGAGIFGMMYTVAASPTRTVSRLGLRGLKRQRALDKSESWRTLEPFVRWLGVRVSGVISDEMAAKIDEQISLAGDYMGITADEFVAMSIMSAIGGLISGILIGWVSELRSYNI